MPEEARHGIPFADAKAIVQQHIKPNTRIERLPLADAHMRVVAEEVIANVDVPPFRSSAMDGYAINVGNLEGVESFRIVGRSLAGHPHTEPISKGEAIRVFTGSSLPAGADAVIVQEEARVEGNRLYCKAVNAGTFVRDAGINLAKGQQVCTKGTLLDGRALSQLAAVGTTEVSVFDRLNVAIANTGDEIIEVGNELQFGQIYNTNQWYLRGRVSECYQRVDAVMHIEDSLEATLNTIAKLIKKSDILIISGGASVGDADFVREALTQLGTVHFNKVASRPGKPLGFATIDNTTVFSLPGNPASVAVGFEQMVKPAMALMQHQIWPEPLRVKAITETDLSKPRGRLEFQRAICRRDGNQLLVRSVRSQDSAAGSSLLQANCFIVIDPDESGVKAGEVVDIELFHAHF